MSNFCSVTVTFNTDLSTGELQKQIKYLVENNFKPLIVDNGSSNYEEIVKTVSSISSGIRTIHLDHNYGLGRALNIGTMEVLNKCDCDWIMSLDQDTYFYRDTFENLFDAIKKNDSISIFGLNYEKCRYSNKFLSNPTQNEVMTDFVITSGMIVKREVYSKVMYNEKLFVYFEDYDFCNKAMNAGFKIMLCSKARMKHLEGNRKIKNGREYFMIEPKRLDFIGRNSVWMMRKYWSINPVLYTLMLVFENCVANNFPFRSLLYAFKGIVGGIVLPYE